MLTDLARPHGITSGLADKAVLKDALPSKFQWGLLTPPPDCSSTGVPRLSLPRAGPRYAVHHGHQYARAQGMLGF